jgi:hypothetical protein
MAYHNDNSKNQQTQRGIGLCEYRRSGGSDQDDVTNSVIIMGKLTKDFGMLSHKQTTENTMMVL